MSTLLLNAKRVVDLADMAAEQIDEPTQLVAVSAAMYRDPDGNDRARLNASIATAASSRAAGVPHIFMLDHTSPKEVQVQLENAGAIVLPVAADEGGLARPYLTGSSVVDVLCERGTVHDDALMVKVEGEKDVFGFTDTPEDYLMACLGKDIMTGVRSLTTWRTMPYYLALTEGVISDAIGQVLGISGDTPSGVLVLSARGREVLRLTTDENSWTYLIRTPYEGGFHGASVGEFSVTFKYHPEVVAEENGNPVVDAKRRHQVQAMFGYAVELEPSHKADMQRLVDRVTLGLHGVCSVSSTE